MCQIKLKQSKLNLLRAEYKQLNDPSFYTPAETYRKSNALVTKIIVLENEIDTLKAKDIIVEDAQVISYLDQQQSKINYHNACKI